MHQEFLTLLCLIVGGSNCKFWGKNPQVHLVIIRQWPKNTPHPPILGNLDNFPPGVFYSTPLPTIRHKRLSKLLTFVFIVLKSVFLTTSLSTTSLVFKSIGTVFNLPTSKSSTFVSELLKLVGTLTSLAISNLSSSAFKPKKSFLPAKSDISTPVA